jgi:TPR repeat protein
MKDHYQTLGLGRAASPKQIKQAYRELCKQYHPDHNKSPDAHARMQEINEAHRVLSSPVSKAEYDQLLRLQEQQGKQASDAASAPGTTVYCRCEKCGRVDPTLRVTVFTWVVSVLVLTYRRGWAKILCARCRTKYALLFDLQNFFMGWWGFPFGIFWTLQALWHNSMGGRHPLEGNALFLAGLGYELSRKGNLKAAVKALEASLAFKKDARVEAFCQQVKARCYEAGSGAPPEPQASPWQRLATGRLHPAVYCAPMLAILFCLASLWLGSENKSPVRARSVPARVGSGAIEEKRVKAERGDAQSQYELARTFYVAQDYGEAVKWLSKAAEQNYAAAQFSLGSSYANGIGVAQDYVEAVKWLSKAAEQNDAAAQCSLGSCYQYGHGVAQDYVEAVKWFRKAAEQNDAEAQYSLGCCYGKGNGVTQDYVEAVKWCRKAAEQNYPDAQASLGFSYSSGNGVAQDYVEAVKWYRKAAEQNNAHAQSGGLGFCYEYGYGVAQDYVEAVRWYRKAAEQNDAAAQCSLGSCYQSGHGVAQDYVEAVKWFRKAAEQNHAEAQYSLGCCYAQGNGVVKDYVEAYKWILLAAAQGDRLSDWILLATAQGDRMLEMSVTGLESLMTPEQIAEGQRLARAFRPHEVPTTGGEGSPARIAQTRPESSGTGFFITDDGYLITNEHVAGAGTQVRLVTEAGILPARIVRTDVANDLALLKVEGRFVPLPLVSSRAAKMGSTVATVGFPNIGLQGFAPKLAKGEIAALSGAQDDPRYFQISVPVQPGNSGGALVDEHGNVVGVVSAKLDVAAAVATSGALPENVNYAVKSSLLLSFLESTPEVSARLKRPNARERKFEEVARQAEQAAALVLVY